MKSYKDMIIQINEVLKKSDSIETWISDFVHSDAPQFKGKSKEKRIEMAKAAYYAAQKDEGVIQPNGTDKVVKTEDVKKLHEVSPHTKIQNILKKIQDRKNIKPVSDKAYADHVKKSVAARDEYVKKEREAGRTPLYKLSTEDSNIPALMKKPVEEGYYKSQQIDKMEDERLAKQKKSSSGFKPLNPELLKKAREWDKKHPLPKVRDVTPKGYGPNESSSHVYVSDTNAKKVLGKHDSLFKAKAHMNSLYKKNPKGKYAMHTGNLSNTLGIKEATDLDNAAKQSKKAQMVAKHASEREALAKKQQREKDSMKEETTMLSFEDFLKEADMKNAVKYAVGLAKKHAGNMTHAVKSIEKKRKGLSNHPDVEKALRIANEEYYCEELDWSYEEFLEEWTQLDELSKGTLKNYLKKKIGTVPHDADDETLTAKLDARDNFSDANRKYSYHAGGGHGTKTPSRAEIQKGIKKDNKNINRALHKLAKEEVEFFQLNELSKGKLVKYVKKAANTVHKQMQPIDGPDGDPEDLEPSDKYFKRIGHINKAINKIGKKSKKTEGWDKTETVKHPNQKVLDVDDDGKIEKDDFKKLRKGHRGKKDESNCNEGANKKMKGDDPCWDSHEMVGMKMKNGKKVPNCVPKKEGVGDWINNKLNQLGDKITQHTMKQAAKNPAELKRLKQGMALAALEKEEVESSDDALFETEKKTFKAFTSEMQGGRYVHKGTRYGGAAQKDDEHDAEFGSDGSEKEILKNRLFGKPVKKEPAVKPVKRSRGRPSGSNSGARRNYNRKN